MKKAVLILSLVVYMSCNESTKKENEATIGKFSHTVFFWLKNPDSKDDRLTFETSLKYFINNSVYVKTKHIGSPANTDRDVIDNTYTYSLLLTFEDKVAHDAYQEEPNHKKFVNECMGLWNKVVVYDSENSL